MIILDAQIVRVVDKLDVTRRMISDRLRAEVRQASSMGTSHADAPRPGVVVDDERKERDG
jgi:hypothetical protein